MTVSQLHVLCGIIWEDEYERGIEKDMEKRNTYEQFQFLGLVRKIFTCSILKFVACLLCIVLTSVRNPKLMSSDDCLLEVPVMTYCLIHSDNLL